MEFGGGGESGGSFSFIPQDKHILKSIHSVFTLVKKNDGSIFKYRFLSELVTIIKIVSGVQIIGR